MDAAGEHARVHHHLGRGAEALHGIDRRLHAHKIGHPRAHLVVENLRHGAERLAAIGGELDLRRATILQRGGVFAMHDRIAALHAVAEGVGLHVREGRVGGGGLSVEGDEAAQVVREEAIHPRNEILFRVPEIGVDPRRIVLPVA